MRFFLRKRPDPTVPDLDPGAIVRRARRLRFRVRPTAVAQLAGAYHSARPGSGLTFAELRAYEPGDDVRHLDWNVTARQGRPFVRRYVEERSLSLWLILDVSQSLRFGADGRSKSDRASQAAALLAASAIQNGDRAALTLVSDRIESELPPGGGPRHLSRLLRMLVTSPSTSRRSSLTAAVARPQRFARRGLVVVLSDFLSPEPVAPWRELASRGDVVALRLVDPLEERLPSAGILALEDAETGRRRLVDSGSARLRASYARMAEDRQRAFRSWCEATSIEGLDLSTQLDPIGPLLGIFRGRARRRTGPR